MDQGGQSIATNQTQRRIRKIISEYISAEERADYSARSRLRSLLTFGHIWLALAVSFVLIVLLQQQPMTTQLCIAPLLLFFIGTRINALAVQVHEGSHGLLMPDKRSNDWF